MLVASCHHDVEMPDAALKTNDLIERLGVVAAAPALDELELRRIARQAQALMKVDPAGAHTLLGGVAAQRGDAVGTRRHHDIALDLDAGPAARCNYVTSLSHLGSHQEALKVADAGLSAYPDDADLLDGAITAAVESANFVVAHDLVNRYQRLFPDQRHPKATMTRKLADAVESGLFRESNVRSVLDMAGSIQRGTGIRLGHSSITAIPFEPDYFSYRRYVFAAPESVSKLNWAFADQIADQPDLMEDPGLKFLVGFAAA